MSDAAIASARSTRSASSFRSRRQPLAPKDGCCLCALLASHISSRRRLEFLKLCLDSIAAQSEPPEALYLSWYAEESLAAEALSMLRGVRLPCRFRHCRQSRRLSQYCHLREALAAHDVEAPRDPAGAAASWLIFSDDDDLWHPDRARVSRRACARASLPPARARALAFGVYAYPVEEAAQEAKTAAQVDRALDQRQCGVWLGASEVFQYAVRPELLRTFLANEPDAVLCHRFCDVRFATWMRREVDHGGRGLVRELSVDELAELSSAEGGRPARPLDDAAKSRWLVGHWMYYYRNTRALSAVRWMGDLEDLHDHLKGASAAEAAKAHQGQGGGGGGGDDGYSRASTGRERHERDLGVARRALRSQPHARTRCTDPSPCRALVHHRGRCTVRAAGACSGALGQRTRRRTRGARRRSSPPRSGGCDTTPT